MPYLAKSNRISLSSSLLLLMSAGKEEHAGIFAVVELSFGSAKETKKEEVKTALMEVCQQLNDSDWKHSRWLTRLLSMYVA